jgi:hypothetical protein
MNIVLRKKKLIFYGSKSKKFGASSDICNDKCDHVADWAPEARMHNACISQKSNTGLQPKNYIGFLYCFL